MVLEAVMVVVDNSEHSRNGDFVPTRFEAQADAVNILFQSITQSNAESSVGLMSMGGKRTEVLSTLTMNAGKIMDGLHQTKKNIGGSANLAVGINIASLALKHRENKQQRQRIIVFVCSPVLDEEKKLVALARKMKKMSVSVDFVLFGQFDDQDTANKLEAFNAAVKGSEGSHLVTIMTSDKLLSDQLIGTPIMLGEGAPPSSGAGMGGGVDGFGDFDFDPNMEPELALALRMSMEEEKARQERVAREEAEAAKKASLADIQEGDESAQPLLDKDGQPSGSGESSKKDGDKGGKRDGGDKMDTS